MCGRYTLLPKADEIAKFFQLPPSVFALKKPRFNIAPTQPVLIIHEQNKKRQADHMLWGLIPSWSPEPKPNASMINARGETLTQKVSFRDVFKRRRCIIPASGFFEWKAEGRLKQPYYITPTNDPFFGFAGLWEECVGIRSCCVVTTSANSVMEKFHDRMPVILKKEDFGRWIESNENVETLKPLLKQFPADEMGAVTVSNFVSNARNQGPQCIEPFTPPVPATPRQEPTLFY